MASDDRLLLVADRDGQVVGFAESEHSSSDATLLRLHVDPAHRGEGIADALFDETRERLASLGRRVPVGGAGSSRGGRRTGRQ